MGDEFKDKIIEKEVENLKSDFKDFKDYSYNKFAKLEASIDSSNKIVDTLRIEMTKFTTLFTEKFNQLEKKLDEKKTDLKWVLGWVLGIGSLVISIIVNFFK